MGIDIQVNQCNLQLVMKDENIIAIRTGHYYSMVLKSGGEIFAFGSNTGGKLGVEKVGEAPGPIFVTKMEGISIFISGNKLRRVWSPEKHHSFSPSFRLAVFTFLLCMNHFRESTGLKVPKFVLFEIFKITV